MDCRVAIDDARLRPLRANSARRSVVVGSVAAVVGALCACGVAGIRADEAAPLRVSIHLEVHPSIASRLRHDIVEEETAAIWRPYGVQLDWTDARVSGAASEDVSFLEAIVEQRLERPELPDKATVLGQAEVNVDRLTRQPIRASFEAMESLLAPRISRDSFAWSARDQEISRALGRVLAHEIGHVLLGVPYHDQTGLMRAAFGAEELVNPQREPFRLTCNNMGRLRSRLPLLTADARFNRGQEATAAGLLASSLGAERDSSGRSTCVPQRAVR